MPKMFILWKVEAVCTKSWLHPCVNLLFLSDILLILDCESGSRFDACQNSSFWKCIKLLKYNDIGFFSGTRIQGPILGVLQGKYREVWDPLWVWILSKSIVFAWLTCWVPAKTSYQEDWNTFIVFFSAVIVMALIVGQNVIPGKDDPEGARTGKRGFVHQLKNALHTYNKTEREGYEEALHSLSLPIRW